MANCGARRFKLRLHAQTIVWASVLLFLMVGVAILLTLDPAAPVVQRGLACVRRDQHAEVGEVHFAPGLQQHQSWISFRGVSLEANFFELCLDGQQLGTPPHEIDGSSVRFSLSTTWVNFLWARHLLGAYRDPSHWAIYWYTCYKPDDQHYICD